MWFLYIAHCNDGTLYTGITKNIDRREIEHNTNNTRGAKSLRNKRPVRIVYTETFATQTEAAKREKSIKKWTREHKFKLIDRARSSIGRATPS